MTISRTVEKILAWIANVILIIVTLILAVLKFSGSLDEAFKSTEFKVAFEQSLRENGAIELVGNVDQLIETTVTIVSAYSVLLIIISIFAITASVTMKRRIFSGILFLVLALVILVISLGFGIVIYLPYFIVSMMLFFRKDKPKLDDFGNGSPEVDKIEYV